MMSIISLFLLIMVSSIHAASPESIQLTHQIANKARNNMTRILGQKVNSKIDATVKEFEYVAPDIIDRNLAELQQTVSSQEKLSPKAQHKLASKYARKTTKEIRSEMKKESANQQSGLSKRDGTMLGNAADITKNVVGIMALGAAVLITGIILAALITYFISIIRRYMYRYSYGYGYPGAYPSPY